MKISEDGPSQRVDLIPPSDGNPGVIKTVFSWAILDRFEVSENSLRIVFSPGNEVPPSKSDLQIVLRAAAILSDESAWDRADDRVCKPDDTTWSLYCALRRATEEVAGRPHHRQPALQVVRVVVREQFAERITNHRLMNFNNHADTTLAEIQDVLRIAGERIKARLAELR